MKMLVTGCCGFIGSNLTKRLLDDGHTVIGIDKRFSELRLPYGKKISAKINRMKNNPVVGLKILSPPVFKVNDRFLFIKDDINHLMEYTKYFIERVDRVYHLAAYVAIRDEKLEDNINDTVNGTFAVLDYITKWCVPELVFTSTSSIYGDNAIGFVTERDGFIEPISHYAAGKVANEAYITSYSSHHPFKSCIFRFANVTGRNQNRGVIWDLLYKLKNNPDELEVLGDGKQRKSFFDVDDCVEALVNIPFKDDKKIEVYNLGNKEIITIGELARIVCDEAGYEPVICYTGGDRGWVGDTPNTEINVDKALSTGWKPRYTCEESIRRTVRWMLDNWSVLNA
jgi:UDP-glucose 4-epimerase